MLLFLVTSQNLATTQWWLSHTNVFGSKMVILKPKRLCSWHEKWLISCCHSCPLPIPQAHAPITLRRRGRVTWFLAGPGGTAKSGEGLESHKWQRSTELLTEPLKIPSTFSFHKTVMHVFCFPQSAFFTVIQKSSEAYLFTQCILKLMNQNTSSLWRKFSLLT